MTELDIVLPTQYAPPTSANLQGYFSDLLAFLTSPLVSSIFSSHPNDMSLDTFNVPEIWDDWWDWASSQNSELDDPLWKSIVQLATNKQTNISGQSHIPSGPIQMITQAKSLALPRESSLSVQDSTPAFLMKEKKAHEVSRMSSYVGKLAQNHCIRYAVDIGAGQGYVTKALASNPYGMNVLALEGSSSQIEGSRQRDGLKQKSNAIKRTEKASDLDGGQRITYQRLQVNGTNLLNSVDDWMKNMEEEEPVLLMGLHACGGLTPSIMRSFLSSHRRSPEGRWSSAGMVVVGCCYHLMQSRETDFPMSQEGKRLVTKHDFRLRQDHLMMASQSPVAWLKDEEAIEEAGVSLRKVTYRALYARLDHRIAKLGLSRAGERVYRVQKKECETLERYLAAANMRQGGDERRLNAMMAERDSEEDEKVVMRRIEMVQTLRCVLGPLVESMLLVDRVVALEEGMDGDGRVGLVAVFDELANSPRNMALVACAKE